MSSAGGLIQITNYGSHDIMLTNNPEITFFKLIYRRYTNFGKIFVTVKFDNPVSFGSTSVLNIPKSYDLLSNLILQIKLPTFDNSQIINLINNENASKIEKYNTYYETFLSFINQLQNIINNFFTNVSSDSVTYISDLNDFITTYIPEAKFEYFFTIVNFFFTNSTIPTKNIKYYTNASLYKNSTSSENVVVYIYQNTSENTYTLEMFNNLINANVVILKELNVIMYNILLNSLNTSTSITLEWVDKIAIYLFEYLEIDIGSNQIVKLKPNYIDMYGQLTYKNNEIYDRMINDKNNDKVFKSYFKNQKFDSYVYLPVPFWFCQTYGLAFPLVALQFNTLQLKIKLKKAVDLIYFNIPDNVDKNIVYKIKDLISQSFLNNINNVLKSDLEVNVLLEYISLDSPERQKFVQSGHEYLITQVQDIVFDNASTYNSKFELNFFHCVKDLYWCVTQYRDTNNIFGENFFDKYYANVVLNSYSAVNKNYIGYLNNLYNPFRLFDMYQYIIGLNTLENLFLNNLLTEEQYNNDIGIVNQINIIKKPYLLGTSITLNSTEFINQESNFYNYLQPYIYYNSTPDYGVNVYSFSLHPTDFQPSGSINMGRIPSISINLDLLILDKLNILKTTENILYPENTQQNNDYQVKIFACNYNVLRIIGGIAGLAFQY
jgi:hypothetical protein